MANLILHHEAIIRQPPKTADYQEFPQMMTHPAFQPGEVGEEVTDQSGFKHFVNGKSVRFPPVLVHSEDDRAYYEAQGYVSQGKSDAAAFQRAITAASQARTPAGYVPQRYPMWVGGRLVHNEDEEREAQTARQAQLGIVAEDATNDNDGDELDDEEAEQEPARAAAPANDDSKQPHPDMARIAALEADVAALKATFMGGFAEMKAMLALITPPPPVVTAAPPPANDDAQAEQPMTRQQKAAITRKQRAEAARKQAANG